MNISFAREGGGGCSSEFLVGVRARKILNSSLPFEQVALKFCLPWSSLRLLFLRFRQFAWALPIGQVRMKSELPDRKIYLSRTKGRHCFRALRGVPPGFPYPDPISDHFPHRFSDLDLGAQAVTNSRIDKIHPKIQLK